jgi:hemerythrin superfamily protein
MIQEKSIFEVLKEEHRLVADLLKALCKEWNTDRRKMHLDQLSHVIESHTRGEEREVYPVVTEAQGDAVEDSLHDHEKIRSLLSLLQSDTGTSDWSEKLAELKDAIEHHVDDEEGRLFTLMRNYFTEAELCEIAMGYLEATHRVRTEAA